MHQRRACVEAQGEAMIEQAIVVGRLSMESRSTWINAMRATGYGPSGLGMMQPEGRPQQGKLKT